jgi:aminopeptidase N
MLPIQPNIYIRYFTISKSYGLQWSISEDGHPLLFTLACPINTRDFIPIQDTPSIRLTYDAKVEVPRNYMALMSATNNPKSNNKSCKYNFNMHFPIPPYLISLIVGYFQYFSLDKISGIYADPNLLEAAINEFQDLPKIISCTEKSFGKYLWDRYDLLIIPKNFPAGGMENPCLTYLSPTVITGDKSFITVIIHELAHAWTGNLVTNYTWNDLWLNEGITTYLQNRVVEEIFGREQALLELRLIYDELLHDINNMPIENTILYKHLQTFDPSEMFNRIPYVKGCLFMKDLEKRHGRIKFDKFIKNYINEFAFKSITTEDFKNYYNRFFQDSIGLDNWLYETGFPKDFKEPAELNLDIIIADTWRTQKWLYFLNKLPLNLNKEYLKKMEDKYNLLNIENITLRCKWISIRIKNNYIPSKDILEKALVSTGKISLVKPIYQELINSDEGLEIAKEIYAKAKNFYHELTNRAIKRIINRN